MKTDKELLELAAKAEGRTLKYMSVIDGKGNRIGEEFIACWNPLVDDGDAFRLAVKLGMCIDCYWTNQATVFSLKQELDAVLEPWGEDRNAATRRAIVRAAAAIGETM